MAEIERGVSLESCGTWTEVEEKWGYDKSWNWKNDAALSMACSQGHLLVVQLLLQRKANLHHRTCNECDVHYTPLEISLQMRHLRCARVLKEALRLESEEKAKQTREDALRIYYAATEEDMMRQEWAMLAGRWQNRYGRFRLEHSSSQNIIFVEEGALSRGILSRRCDGWWQGQLSRNDEIVGLIRLRLSLAAYRQCKIVHQTKIYTSQVNEFRLGLRGGSDTWGDVARSSKLTEGLSVEEACRFICIQLAQREARLEIRREALREERACERQLEREQLRREMRSILRNEVDDMSEGSDSDLQSDYDFSDGESDVDFDNEFDEEDDTDEDDTEAVNVVQPREHSMMLYNAAMHLRKGEGGGTDLGLSARLCSHVLSIEIDRLASECESQYSTFGKAMQLLRSLASDGVVAATDALPFFSQIEEAKSHERDARRRAFEQERKACEEARQRKRDDCLQLRRREVDRCRPLICRPLRTGGCTNTNHHNADFCTYKHSGSRDLPPHCLHFSRGACRNGDNCWFNHLRCVCGSCRL